MLRLTDKVVFLTGCGSVGPGWGNGKSIAVLSPAGRTDLRRVSERGSGARDSGDHQGRGRHLCHCVGELRITDPERLAQYLIGMLAKRGRG
jgi:hypothetical protein